MDQRVKFGHMTFQKLKARDVDGAINEILNLLQTTSNGTTIYFNGWQKGLGTAAVLRSIAQVLKSKKDPPPKLCFSKIIYIDCSTWKGIRVMQRRIAEELMLDPKTMSMFDEHDKEDDFNGVDPTSRDVIQDVATVIDRTLRESSFMMIFLNGSDEEVVLSRLGVPEYQEHTIIWTFKRRFPTKGLSHVDSSSAAREIASKLRNTNIFLASFGSDEVALTSSEATSELVREEAASVLSNRSYLQGDDRAMVINCYLYVLFLHYSFYESTRKLWAAHGANYWICDGIIQGARTREIIKILSEEVSFECDEPPFDDSEDLKRIMMHANSPFLVLDDENYNNYNEDEDDSDNDNDDDDDNFPSWIKRKRDRHWISITSKNMIFFENIKNISTRISSMVLPFEITNIPQRLPVYLFKKCETLRVLILSNCAFNFLSPLFGHCNTLRFLGLDHCKNNYALELLEKEDNAAKWAFLRSLWVLDLRYTYWDEILSEGNMNLMGNIMELDIEGSTCWQYVGELEGKLPYLQRLRIVKPLHQTDTSTGIDGSFMEKKRLELLDLSGNRDMKNLPTSLSKGSSLQVLVLDGCVGLEKVVLSSSLLRSLSFDGYGPASHWTSMDELPQVISRPKCPSNDDNIDVKTSLITLKGCTQLKNLFLRGLPKLVELDLSGCAIKILDFETMVVGVPNLKRLFLLCCEHLCAISWGGIPLGFQLSEEIEVRMPVDLELVCIDTRPSGEVSGHTRPSIAQDPNKNFGLQVYVVTADARLVRSLTTPIVQHEEKKGNQNYFFDIRMTSSNIIYNEEPNEEHHVVVGCAYDDVSIEVGDSCLTPMQAFPQPPNSRLDRHIEIGEGRRNVESEVEVFNITTLNLSHLMIVVQSLHVHDWSTSATMGPIAFKCLKWCHVERCSRLDPVFASAENAPSDLEIIWASDLLTARCIWSKSELIYDKDIAFRGLQHLYIRSCPSLQFALPVWASSFHMLKTLHILHCGSLKHVFALDNKKYDINSRIWFPNLTTIHLHDVPALQQICEAKMMAPKLKVIKTRGCWNLRRLPALKLKGKRVGLVERHRRWRRWLDSDDDSGGDEEGERRRPPTVEMEKDVWDALEWDGVESGHHPSLYEAPVYSRHYKRRGLLRRTVLR